ncbi:hypothetical protein BT96DRAFT_1026420 [Gymnopus androsaceus JB14]|uniref:Integral membrane protein n=1 Tax=Gymnopus androsaceus JB14 TaxID=1447944 RepID=A0A6A4GKX0_9AGAR|nr:hypothetical protein BT96DRAFT_1026420 [Gymnopus androsaceus JB14]
MATSVPAAELAIDHSWNDAYLVSAFVELFMDGLYTALMILAVLVVISIKQTHTLSNYIIYTSIFLLYAMCMIHLGSWCFHIRDGFINHTGDTTTIFTFISMNGVQQSILRDVMAVAMTLVADLILVWRVFALWGSNWKIGIVPLILTLFALAFGIQYIVLATKPSNLVTLQWITDVAGIYYGSTLGNTVISTSLILFRVHRLSGTKGINRYWRILSLVVESAALYSVILIIYMPYVTGTDFATHAPTEIVQSVVIPITGIAPTLLVIRVIINKEISLNHTDGDRSFFTDIVFSSRNGAREENLTEIMSNSNVTEQAGGSGDLHSAKRSRATLSGLKERKEEEIINLASDGS